MNEACDPAMHHRLRLLRPLVLGSVVVILTGSSPLQAQEAGSATPVTDTPSDSERETSREGSLLTVEIIQSVLGETTPRPNGVRYLVVNARFINNSEDEVTLPVANIHLSVDGQKFLPQIEPPSLKGYAFDSGRESIRFRDLESPRELSLAPANAVSAWIVFTDLPGSGDIPRMDLETNVATESTSIDLNDVHQKLLKLTHEQIGPRGVLGLFTIAGKLDTINVAWLVEELNRSANQGTSRVVLSFADSAAPLPDLLGQWLEQAAHQRDRSRIQARFPGISPLIHELHVVNIPGEGDADGQPHLHQSTAAAVEAALEPIFRILAADEVISQIEKGHPLVRAAALATGGRQFAPAHLPLVLKFATESDDPLLKRGALLALSEFGQPEAISCLVDYTTSHSVDMRVLAVECLAASRFENAHAALEQLLASPLRVPLLDLTRILSRYPRERWIEPLRQLAAGEWTDEDASQNERIAVRREALEAINRIGHPGLVELLGQALASEQASIRQTAFSLLMNRTDNASEQMAVEYALQLTEEEFPSQQIVSLFQRVRDERAVPLLVKHLNSNGSDRSRLIKTLAQIGPSSIDQTLADCYPDLHPREQANVIASLTDLDSPLAYSLAKQAILEEETVLFHPSVRAIQEQATPEAVSLLSDVLLDHLNSNKVSSLVRALESIGTPDAINAMRRAKFAGDSRTEQYIAGRLAEIQERSPASEDLRAANEKAREEQWPEAVEFYTSAIDIDPGLSDAYSGRGHCRLHLEQLEPAGDDFRHALRSNPYDSLAVTGLAIVLVRQGDIETGIQMVEDAGDRFPHDWVFAYNTACVYGRALELTLEEPPTMKQESRIAALQEQAITQLRLAVERGFDQFEFMQRDPDLAPLTSLEAFQELQVPDREASDR